MTWNQQISLSVPSDPENSLTDVEEEDVVELWWSCGGDEVELLPRGVEKSIMTASRPRQQRVEILVLIFRMNEHEEPGALNTPAGRKRNRGGNNHGAAWTPRGGGGDSHTTSEGSRAFPSCYVHA